MSYKKQNIALMMPLTMLIAHPYLLAMELKDLFHKQHRLKNVIDREDTPYHEWATQNPTEKIFFIVFKHNMSRLVVIVRLL